MLASVPMGITVYTPGSIEDSYVPDPQVLPRTTVTLQRIGAGRVNTLRLYNGVVAASGLRLEYLPAPCSSTSFLFLFLL